MLSSVMYYYGVQYIPRNMHTVFALLCFVVVILWLIFPYPSGLLHWHCGNLTIAPVSAKQPWWIWINTSCEFIMDDCLTTTKQSTTKPCAYFLGYTVYPNVGSYNEAMRINKLSQYKIKVNLTKTKTDKQTDKPHAYFTGVTMWLHFIAFQIRWFATSFYCLSNTVVPWNLSKTAFHVGLKCKVFSLARKVHISVICQDCACNIMLSDLVRHFWVS